MGLLCFIAHGFLLYGAIEHNDKGVVAYLVFISIAILFDLLFDIYLGILGVQYPALAYYFYQKHDPIQSQEKTFDDRKDEKVGQGDTEIIFHGLFKIFFWLGCFTLYKELKKDGITKVVTTV